MLGGSLAAQPEHETISVNRMGSPPLIGGIEDYGLYHCQLPIGDLPGSIGNCRLPIAD